MFCVTFPYSCGVSSGHTISRRAKSFPLRKVVNVDTVYVIIRLEDKSKNSIPYYQNPFKSTVQKVRI